MYVCVIDVQFPVFSRRGSKFKEVSSPLMFRDHQMVDRLIFEFHQCKERASNINI